MIYRNECPRGFLSHFSSDLMDEEPHARPGLKRGTHKRTYRIRSNVHSQFTSTQNSVYSMNFCNSHQKQELDLLEIGLKYQCLQPMLPNVVSSTTERSIRIRPTVFF